MVKDHSDGERGNLLGYSFRLAARVLLYAPTHRWIAHTAAFVTPVVEHWLEHLLDGAYKRSLAANQKE